MNFFGTLWGGTAVVEADFVVVVGSVGDGVIPFLRKKLSKASSKTRYSNSWRTANDKKEIQIDFNDHFWKIIYLFAAPFSNAVYG